MKTNVESIAAAGALAACLGGVPAAGAWDERRELVEAGTFGFPQTRIEVLD